MSRNGDELVDPDVELLGSTDRAWRVRDGNLTEAWVPKSVTEVTGGETSWRVGQTRTITIPLWKVEDAGLE